MDKNEDQFPAQRKIKDHKIISNLEMTRKKKDTNEPVARITLGRELNLLHEEGTPHPVVMKGPDRMSGVGTARDIGVMLKQIAATKPKDK